MTQVTQLGREMDLLPQTQRRFEPDDLRELAFSFHGNDWNRSARIWEAFRILFPNDADGFIFGTLALREAGRLAEADALSGSVLEVFSHHARLFNERALICFFTSDWPEAKRRLAHIRRAFPGELEAYVRGAEVAQNMGQPEEALQLMQSAVKQFPDDRSVLENYARLAERLANSGRAAAAWGEHRERYGEAISFIGQAQGLANAGDTVAAEAVLAEGAAQYPGSREIRAEAARLAVRRGAWPDVVRRWTALADHPEYADEAASRLKDATYFLTSPTRWLEADDGRGMESGALGAPLATLLSKTWTFSFRHGQLLCQNLRLGPRGELLNHYGAERRWVLRNRCIALLDGNDYITALFDSAEIGTDGRQRLIGRDWLHPTIDSYVVLEEQRPTMATVMAAFESLGDNCEFGLAQRFYRAEPLGLLRFGSAGYDDLMSALSSNYAALDAPDCMKMHRDSHGELIGFVEAYHLYYHTHRFNADIDVAAFERTEAVRLRYLADLLIENIEGGSKIFVRKGEKSDDLDKVLRLHDTMKRIGDCMLLWVTEADEAHPSGTVEMLGGGLMHAYIEKFSPYYAAGMALFDCWADICVRVHQLVFPAAWGDTRLAS